VLRLDDQLGNEDLLLPKNLIAGSPMAWLVLSVTPAPALA